MRIYRDEADNNPKDSFDEYSTRDEPRQKSFDQKYGFDERDGPPEQEDDEDEKPWGKWDRRSW